MPTTQMNGLVRTFTEDELLERRAEVVKKLERRFGSLERALEREQDYALSFADTKAFAAVSISISSLSLTASKNP